jgi:hypothetical protein
MSYRSVFSFLMTMVISVFVSCSDDEKIVDKPVPEINFEQSEQKYFSGVTDLTFQSSETQSIARVRILVDDVEVADEAFDSPSDEFTFAWDSKSVEDGEHTITVIVTDAEGNEVTEIYDVVVRNILRKYIVEPGSLFFDDTWIFLSDKDGKNLGAQPLIEGTEAVFYAPGDFQDETFSVTEFLHRGSGSKERIFRMNTDMKPSVVVYNTIEWGTSPPAIGRIHYRVTGIPSGFMLMTSGRNMNESQAWITSEGIGENSADITANEADLFITIFDNAGNTKYKWLEGVHADDEFTLTFDEFEDFEVSYYPVTENGTFFHLQMGSLEHLKTDYVLGFFDEKGNSGVPIVRGPEGMFDNYFSILSIREGNIGYEYSGYSAEPVTINPLPVAIASFDFNDNQLNLSINGGADFMRIQATHAGNVGSVYIRDEFAITTRPESQVSVPRPTIPREILEKYFNEQPMTALSFTDVYFTDDARLSSYEDYLSGNYSGDQYNSTTKIISLAEEGGRVGSRSNTLTLLFEDTHYQVPDEVRAARKLLTRFNK